MDSVVLVGFLCVNAAWTAYLCWAHRELHRERRELCDKAVDMILHGANELVEASGKTQARMTAAASEMLGRSTQPAPVQTAFVGGGAFRVGEAAPERKSSLTPVAHIPPPPPGSSADRIAQMMGVGSPPMPQPPTHNPSAE